MEGSRGSLFPAESRDSPTSGAGRGPGGMSLRLWLSDDGAETQGPSIFLQVTALAGGALSPSTPSCLLLARREAKPQGQLCSQSRLRMEPQVWVRHLVNQDPQQASWDRGQAHTQWHGVILILEVGTGVDRGDLSFWSEVVLGDITGKNEDHSRTLCQHQLCLRPPGSSLPGLGASSEGPRSCFLSLSMSKGSQRKGGGKGGGSWKCLSRPLGPVQSVGLEGGGAGSWVAGRRVCMERGVQVHGGQAGKQPGHHSEGE